MKNIGDFFCFFVYECKGKGSIRVKVDGIYDKEFRFY